MAQLFVEIFEPLANWVKPHYLGRYTKVFVGLRRWTDTIRNNLCNINQILISTKYVGFTRNLLGYLLKRPLLNIIRNILERIRDLNMRIFDEKPHKLI